jgi:3-isopropylmalate/(R)-2-methylmalate dehydratase large subunit
VAPLLRELGAKVWDPSRFVVVTDHYVPAADPEAESILRFTRDWVREAGIQNFIDNEGICHVVLPERGHVLPGRFIVGGDSHSPTGGAFGAYMFGIGATEMAGVLATGEIWLRVPNTIRVEWQGTATASAPRTSCCSCAPRWVWPVAATK